MVYDITSELSFQRIESWKDNFIEQASPEKVDEFPFLLLGNKSDLENRRQVQTKTAKEYAHQHHMIYYETSAVTSKNINIAIRNIASNASQMDSVPYVLSNIYI